jgi:hypothetical protein
MSNLAKDRILLKFDKQADHKLRDDLALRQSRVAVELLRNRMNEQVLHQPRVSRARGLVSHRQKSQQSPAPQPSPRKRISERFCCQILPRRSSTSKLKYLRVVVPLPQTRKAGKARGPGLRINLVRLRSPRWPSETRTSWTLGFQTTLTLVLGKRVNTMTLSPRL